MQFHQTLYCFALLSVGTYIICVIVYANRCRNTFWNVSLKCICRRKFVHWLKAFSLRVLLWRGGGRGSRCIFARDNKISLQVNVMCNKIYNKLGGVRARNKLWCGKIFAYRRVFIRACRNIQPKGIKHIIEMERRPRLKECELFV